MLKDTVLDVLSRCTQIDTGSIGETDNLFDAGMNSFACVQVMIALEERLDIEFPDEFMRRETFKTINSIISHVHNIDAGVAPAL